VTHAEAASVPISALTAWQALLDHGHLHPGERVLIHGAAGSVGNYAVQLAEHNGAYVIATASETNLDFVRQLGADQVIDYRSAKFEQSAGKVDLVVDTIGGETLQRSWSVLGPRGRLVTVASSAESLVDERTRNAFFIVKPNRNQLTLIASMLDGSAVKTIVKSVITLSEAVSEYVAPSRGAGHGKTVVEI
jgi:NADPH:quinone reductase-like Zn-dependent oxidoreductase